MWAWVATRGSVVDGRRGVGGVGGVGVGGDAGIGGGRPALALAVSAASALVVTRGSAVDEQASASAASADPVSASVALADLVSVLVVWEGLPPCPLRLVTPRQLRCARTTTTGVSMTGTGTVDILARGSPRAGRPELRGARVRGATPRLTVATPRRRRCTTTTATTSPTKTTTCTSMAKTWAPASSITIKLPASHRRVLRRRRRQTADWLPLGVFALTKSDKPKSDVSIQLAVNKQGVIRGNSTDTGANKNQVIQGSVDKQTQRVAFTVGDNTTNVVETGLYNLTKDEAPCLIHFGKDKTEQWLLVRMQKPDAASEMRPKN